MWDGLWERLEGRRVVLEPLAESHRESLWQVAQHEEIWRFLPSEGQTRDGFESLFGDALDAAHRGLEAPYATVDLATGQVVGSTRYLALRQEHRGLEIGWTWLTPSAWRSGINVEAKLLMLEHAFERVGCIRVELKTHSQNERSRRAMEALPAQFEGIFRKHMLRRGGVRDSAYYSIVDDEWPSVKANLERRLDRY